MSEVREFTCAEPECGRRMWRLAGEQTYGLCAACLTMPGWHRDPELVKLLAPGKPFDSQPPTRPQRPRRRFGLVASIAASLWLGVIAFVIVQFF